MCTIGTIFKQNLLYELAMVLRSLAQCTAKKIKVVIT